LEEVAVYAGHKVLMEADLFSLTVSDTQGILDQQLRPHPIHIPNLLNIILISNIIIKLLSILKNEDHYD
jgi:hypothetical protein